MQNAGKQCAASGVVCIQSGDATSEALLADRCAADDPDDPRMPAFELVGHLSLQAQLIDAAC